ncbi:restriction endonuclease subunit S [Exercitatus varius]|uniref:restriction endonuclease subunit S n=1 Tax=Exercitatus varius TaxID=67857 RepID=UPI00294B037E|nr:restriction endonuclease subunit S [Exercitatus varius]MDG2941367.1 restriction endonuclease subunit S [Exercitatus varius]
MKKLKDGWEIKTLGEITTISSGGTPSRKKESYWNGDIPWIRTTEVQNCILNLEDTQEFITKEGLKNSSAKLVPVGTVLLAMIGQGKTRGQVAYLNFEASTNQNCATIIFDKNSEPKFYYQYLLSQYENIRGISNSAGQSNLSGSLVKAIKVPVPPLNEQIQIAETLSTWDNAIQTTEKLLENSRQQKKALMQRLLKGNNWLQADLAELAVISKGSQLNKNTLSDNGQYAVINGGIEPSGYTDKFNTESHTITISEGGNSCGYIGFQKEKFGVVDIVML